MSAAWLVSFTSAGEEGFTGVDVLGTSVVDGSGVTAGVLFCAATKLNTEAPLPDWVSVFVTVTSTEPTFPDGVMQVIDVGDATVTDVQGDPPIVTVAPGANPVPVMVTVSPPSGEPEAGETEVTAGAVMVSNAAVDVVVALEAPRVFVTTTV